MENKALVVLGIDCELVLRRVEDVKQKMTLSGAVQDTRHKDTEFDNLSVYREKIM